METMEALAAAVAVPLCDLTASKGGEEKMSLSCETECAGTVIERFSEDTPSAEVTVSVTDAGSGSGL